MAFRTKTASSSARRVLKSGLNADDQRRKREDVTIELRKTKKEESLMKRRMQTSGPSNDHNEPVSQDNKALTSEEVSNLMKNTNQLLQAIHSDNSQQQLEAARSFRKLLSIERNPPIQHVIDTGVVPRLVSLLSSHYGVAVQFEAAWTLTNIASGSSQHTEHVINQGAVPAFVALLQSPNQDLAEQAVWALGNIAGDSTDCRDGLLEAGTMNGLLTLITPHAKTTMLRNVTWAVSNLCRGKPRPDFDHIRPALRALAHLLNSQDDEVITDAAWALSYITDDNAPGNLRIQAVVQEPGVVARLVHLLKNHNEKIQTPALRCVGNIVTGDDLQTQAVIGAGALPNILGMMVSHKKGIRKEAAWTISNITAGSSAQIQAVIDTHLIPPLVSLLANSEFDVQKEAAWALSNACSGGTSEQIHALVQDGLVGPLIGLLNCADPKIVMVALDGLEIILKHGKRDDRNLYHDHVEEANGLDVLEELQKHENEEVYDKSASLLRTYFEEDNEAPAASAPSMSANQFNFNAAPMAGGFGGFTFS